MQTYEETKKKTACYTYMMNANEPISKRTVGYSHKLSRLFSIV